jgi:hypothetical protein
MLTVMNKTLTMGLSPSERQRRWRERHAGSSRQHLNELKRTFATSAGPARMHYTTVHGRDLARSLPTGHTGGRDVRQAGGGLIPTLKSGLVHANGGEEEDKPAYYKMKLVGPNCAEFITEPMQLARELNPKLSGMIHSAEQMNKVLCDASQQPLEKRRYTTSSVVALHDAHLQRLKGLMSDSDHAYSPMEHSFPEQSQMPVDEPTAPPSQVEEDESSLSSHAAMQKVMSVIPKKFHAKFARLGEYLKFHPGLIRFTPTGRPIVSGREIQHAHIMDIVRSLYLWPKTQALPTGLREVIEALHLAGAPSHVLSNADALRMYHSVYGATQQSHTGMEGYESEAEEQQQYEQEEEEEQQQQREEEEEQETPFATPLHTAMHQMQTIRKAEERAPTKQSPSMIPKPIYAPSKVSGIPSLMSKREASKPSSSQSGKGKLRARMPRHSETEECCLEEGVTEHWYDDPLFPGKPIRVLKLY